MNLLFKDDNPLDGERCSGEVLSSPGHADDPHELPARALSEPGEADEGEEEVRDDRLQDGVGEGGATDSGAPPSEPRPRV